MSESPARVRDRGSERATREGVRALRAGRVTVGMISLGCAKNLVDTERLLAALEAQGFDLVSDPARAEALVVNTCGFITPAREESLEAIRQAAAYRRRGRLRFLVAVGCLVSRDRAALRRAIPEVDLLLDLKEEWNLPRLLARAFDISAPAPVEASPRRRLLVTPPHTVYLKISEGCDRRCAFCTIPGIRGRMVSRPLGELVEEARALEALGARELTLISQDTSRYGRDLNPPRRLDDLLGALLRGTRIPWIRLLYLHPGQFPEGVLDLMASEERLLRYIDLPIQHIADPVLRAMRRGTTRRAIEGLLARIRERVPDIVLRTTVLVGHPGEREAHFEELLGFLEDFAFDRLGVFPYWKERGTAAARVPGRVGQEIRMERAREVARLARRIALRKNRLLVGREAVVLVDGPYRRSGGGSRGRGREGRPRHGGTGIPSGDGGIGVLWEGRTAGQAPEVDGVTVLEGEAKPGQMRRARIVSAGPYDLRAVALDAAPIA